MSVEARLQALGITLPTPAAPVANYVPWQVQGGLVYVSGQLPLLDGTPQSVGVVGDTVSVEAARDAARLCAVNLLAQVRVACGGSLDRVRQVVRLAGFVNAVPGFTQHPQILNGASDLMVEVLREKGRHVRVAVGVASLPLGVPVEVEGLFAIE
ncbi:RidA family protein [Pararhodospirillum photometricum]|nr:RidA family protein [Pararhodospirillum photometricum]